VGKDSADVWERSHLFQLGLGAGAPPDLYSADGQHWGMPLYNWDAMKASVA
jgi:4-alpha-glucanotransferase